MRNGLEGGWCVEHGAFGGSGVFWGEMGGLDKAWREVSLMEFFGCFMYFVG